MTVAQLKILISKYMDFLLSECGIYANSSNVHDSCGLVNMKQCDPHIKG